MARLYILPAVATVVAAQQIGNAIPEMHPKLSTAFCTRAKGCVTKETSVVAEALYHPIHVLGDTAKSCNPNPPISESARVDPAICPDSETCGRNCVFEGADYEKLGIRTDGSALTLHLYQPNSTGGWDGAAPRVYLLAEDEQNYESVKLANQELTFDVDMSLMGCGTNGALYLDEMDMSGNRNALNPAGAAYGTGYCDAQCYNKTFVNGMANVDNSGACCNEMDIWEANSMATALTPHTCSEAGPFSCHDDACGKTEVGVCDKAGCGVNPYKTIGSDFYGPGSAYAVDTSRPFTVVTQFLTADNTMTGLLTDIVRRYIQDGKEIEVVSSGRNAIDQAYCTASGPASFNRLGGLKTAGEALARGMVLTFSVWDSAGDFMNWLDAGEKGPCGPTDGDPAKIVAANPNVAVTWSNIRWGDIGTTVQS